LSGSIEQAVKIGLMVFLANDRENNKRSYDSIRSVAQQAEADGFDSIWLPDHFFYRNPGELPLGNLGMLDYAGGLGRGDTPRGDRDFGRVQFLPASGDTGEDGDDR